MIQSNQAILRINGTFVSLRLKCLLPRSNGGVTNSCGEIQVAHDRRGLVVRLNGHKGFDDTFYLIFGTTYEKISPRFGSRQVWKAGRK